MPDISALDKYPCPACGAQAEWNPAKQLLVCPFCGTAAPFNVNAATGAIEELDLAKALRELPDEERGWQTEKRTVQCQSCKAVSVFDPERVGQNCEFCGSPALVDYTEIKAPIRPQSLLPFNVTDSSVREQIREVVREQVAGAGQAEEPGARRSRARRLHSVLDVRRAGRLPVGRRGRPLLLHDGDLSGRRAHPDASGPARALGAGLGRDRALLRRRAGAGDAGRVARAADAGRAVSDQGARPYDTAFLSGFVVEHYQIVLFDAAKRSRRCDGRQADGDVRRAGSRRHVPQSADPSRCTRARPSSTSSCPSGC